MQGGQLANKILRYLFFPNCIIRGKREMAGSAEKNGIDFSTSLTSLTFDLDTERERVRAIKSYEAT